jgi:dGTPase
MERQSASVEMVPMTLEGCVVRISDVISYLGRDIEDAITVNLIKRYDIPKEITDVLGNDNRHIVNSLILDIINNSYGRESISFSTEGYNALEKLKNWNYKNIYNNPLKCSQDEKIRLMFAIVQQTLLEGKAVGEVKENYDKWLNMERSAYYIAQTPDTRKVADYVSGMTDDFFIKVYTDIVMPKSFGLSF